MSKKKKIILVIAGLIIALLGSWFIYLVSYEFEDTSGSVSRSDGAASAHKFMEYQLELQKKGEIK